MYEWKHKFNTLAFSLVFLLGTAQSGPLTNSNEIIVVDRSNGCFHNDDASHRFTLEGTVYRSGILSVSTQEVATMKEMILQSSTNKQALLTYLGATEEWFEHNREPLIMNSLKSHWANKYPTFDALPPAAQNVIDYAGITNIIMNELADGDFVPSTTEVEFSVTFPGSPLLKISTAAERAGMLPLHVTYGNKKWETYDPNISLALRAFTPIDGPNYIYLFLIQKYKNDGWKPSERNDVLTDMLDKNLCANTYRGMPGYDAAMKDMEIAHAHSGNLINMEPLSLHLTLLIKNKSHIDRAWCWAHLTPEGEPKDSWIDIMELIDDADRTVEDHAWLLEWRNQSPKYHLGLSISGGESRVGSKSFENATLKRIKLEREPNYMLLLSGAGNAKIFVGSEDNLIALYDWKKSTSTPWLDPAAFPLGSLNYALISPEGTVTTK